MCCYYISFVLNRFRTLFVYPQTKTYFSHWADLNPGSPQVKKHGLTVMNGVLNAVELMDDLKGGLLSLSELHAFMLRVDPANFKVGFAENICLRISFQLNTVYINNRFFLFDRSSITISSLCSQWCFLTTSLLRCMFLWTSSSLKSAWPCPRSTDKVDAVFISDATLYSP